MEDGPVPESMCVCHSCDNGSCGRGTHLFLGTLADNNHDRAQKGRSACGQRQPGTKLTERMIECIRWSFRIAGMRISKLARMYEVGETTVGNIVHYRTWKHVPDDFAVAA